MATAAIVSSLAGFSHSMERAAGHPLPPIVLIHAALFASWLTLFLVQTLLVASGHVTLHRRLGTLGALIATTMILSAPPLALSAARRGALPGDPLVFLLVILLDVAFFAVFFGAALYFRRQSERHKRFMLLATTSLLAPGISRWPIAAAHPVVIPLAMLAFVAAAPVYDFLSRRPLNRVSLWGGGALLVSIPLRFALGQSAMWHRIARLLIQ
jgi:hypothetical protein